MATTILAVATPGCSFIASTLPLLQHNFSYINYYLRFRGPHYTGTKSVEGFTMAHNLLWQTGAMTPQPFASADNQVLALFNGEIYNYHALEAELRPSGPPYTSDGQCVIEAYKKWGDAFTQHFDGEFAIVLFDLEASKLLVSTDPFGVKPLFAAVHGDDFGVASYRSGLERAGHTAIEQLGANTMHLYAFDKVAVAGGGSRPAHFRHVRNRPLVSWDVRQHKHDTEAWEAAFEEAVAKRTAGLIHQLFLPLSSGYDSGAIHLALLRLGVPHATYSIVGMEKLRDQQMIEARLTFARSFTSAQRSKSGGRPISSAGEPPRESHVLSLNRSAFRGTMSHLNHVCERYTYRTPRWSKITLTRPEFVAGTRVGTTVKPMFPTDTAAVGVGHICGLARQREQLTLLTGSGADETMTDYGFNGVRYGMQSQFGGYWPGDEQLRRIFPWENFVNGSQRNYLAKDEYVTGAYGVEGRFPFLDAKLVQEGLYLAPVLKNTYYKAGAQLYMRRHGYPYEPCVASAEKPFGAGPGCKKLGFVIPRNGRTLPARFRTAGNAE